MLVSKSLAFHFARGLTQTRTVAAFETTLRQSVKRPAAAMSTSTSDWQRHPPYCVEKKENDFQPTYEGSCHCEAVRFKVRGEPLGVKYCHCKGCQRTHGSPFQWNAVYPKDAVCFTQGLEKLEFYNTQTGEVDRKLPSKVLCKACHSPIANEGKNMMMVLPTTLCFGKAGVPDTFKPTAHVFYQDRVLDMIDGVPKWSGLDGQSEEIDEHEEHKVSHHKHGNGRGETVKARE